MQCQFDAGYLAHVQNKSHSFLFTRHNKRLWSSCTGFKPREQTCFSAEYLGQVTHFALSIYIICIIIIYIINYLHN